MNHLADETSPYLQQHANNPVDWFPWSKHALKKARTENKPVLLSIGYSACHWCHVMASESFMDNETARLMNQYFINIKVDREERPDLDKIYQTTYQLLTGQNGGWPLTVFLMPSDLTPFYAGTYFPLHPRYGLPSFQQVLLSVHDTFTKRELTMSEQAHQLRKSLTNLYQHTQAGQALNNTPITALLNNLSSEYDPCYGGFGQAPKFPNAGYLESLLRHAHLDNNTTYLTMVTDTLTKIANGGIYDQLGGGFYRYSVDQQWMIPHFEKMLYDNAALLALYAQTYAITGKILLKKTGIATANWAMQQMQSETGGYYTSLDADSEHEEGKYYYWQRKQVQRILDDAEYQIFSLYYNLDKGPNFENYWHLYNTKNMTAISQQLSIAPDKGKQLLKQAKDKLLAVRKRRTPPHRDEKILTAWNGLMIKAMALAGHHFQRDDFIQSAQAATDHIYKNLWQDKRLLASYKDGKARFTAYLDDYAFLLDGLIYLLQAEWQTQYLSFAEELADTLLKHYHDKKQGGFFFTADDHEPLILRPKPLTDESLPNGNAVAITALIKLSYLLNEPAYLSVVENSLHMAWQTMTQHPLAHSNMLNALDSYLAPWQTIIVRGEQSVLQQCSQQISTQYHPQRLFFLIPNNIRTLPPSLTHYKSLAQFTAYVCDNSRCQAPVTQLEELFTTLGIA